MMTNLIMPDTWKAHRIIAGFEAFRSNPYLDQAGIPTIGYGCTVYPSGKKVTMRDKSCTQLDALEWLHYWVFDTAKHLWPSFERQPTLNQFSAFLSLAYNVGWVNTAHSTAMKEFNRGNITQAASAFLMWDKIHHDGKLIEDQGLINRRKKEIELFLTPDNG